MDLAALGGAAGGERVAAGAGDLRSPRTAGGCRASCRLGPLSWSPGRRRAGRASPRRAGREPEPGRLTSVPGAAPPRNRAADIGPFWLTYRRFVASGVWPSRECRAASAVPIPGPKGTESRSPRPARRRPRPGGLADAVDAGSGARAAHPRVPLPIYNYTEACAVRGRAGIRSRCACRGLIVDTGPATVLARPLPKFFNHGQPRRAGARPDCAGRASPTRPTARSASSTPTADGLGGGDPRLVRLRPGPARDRGAARRGTPRFTPPAGRHRAWSRSSTRRTGSWSTTAAWTTWCSSARSTSPPAARHGPEAVPGWPGPVVERVRARHAGRGARRAAARQPGRAGRALPGHRRPGEDQVCGVRAAAPDRHRPDRPHGLGAPGRAAATLAALIAPLPDEFHAWVRAVAADLHRGRRSRAAAVEAAYEAIVADCRRAGAARTSPPGPPGTAGAGCLFLRLDGKDYRPLLWQQVRPAADDTPHDLE